jgi:hypothetical protein
VSNLSSAAQAVWDAFDQDAQEREAVAAVLRAAAKHLSYQLPFEDFGRIDVVDLLAIADELEGIKHGTYRCELKALPND